MDLKELVQRAKEIFENNPPTGKGEVKTAYLAAYDACRGINDLNEALRLFGEVLKRMKKVPYLGGGMVEGNVPPLELVRQELLPPLVKELLISNPVIAREEKRRLRLC